MKEFFSVLSTFLAHAGWWAGVFALCLAAASRAGATPWLALPMGLLFGTGWQLVRSARDAGKNRGGSVAAPPRDDPFLEERLEAAWAAGRLSGKGSFLRLFRRPKPWFLCLTGASSPIPQLVQPNRRTGGRERNGLFERLDGGGAVWLDLPFALERNREDVWRRFIGLLSRKGDAAPAAAVIVLEADSLLGRADSRSHQDARTLHRRLQELSAALASPLPVHWIIDGVDKLYGMRSLAAMLPAETLSRPIGAFNAGGTPAGELVADAFARAEALCRLPPPRWPQGTVQPPELAVPAFHAPLGLRRLREATERFLDHVHHSGETGRNPENAGLFLLASRPGGERAAFEPPFTPLREPECGDAPWFTRDLFARLLPLRLAERERLASAAAKRRRNAIFHTATAGFLAGTLILCWLMTWSFVESRGTLLSAATRLRDGNGTEELATCLDAVRLTRMRNEAWTLPRFGMTESIALGEALENRFSRAYYNAKVVSGINRVQDTALAAARSGDPSEIGDALLMTVLSRSALEDFPGDEARLRRDTLRRHAAALGLADEEDFRQLDAYLSLEQRRDWIPAARETLRRFETYLLTGADGGDWLPSWVESLPGLSPVSLEPVWRDGTPGTPKAVAPAWTKEGYAAAKTLLLSADPDNGDGTVRRDALLAEYRRRALETWQGAAATVFREAEERIANAGVGILLSRAAEKRDPGAVFLLLAGDNLFPIFEETGAGDDPGIVREMDWLRLRLSLDGEPVPASVPELRDKWLRLAAALEEAVTQAESESEGLRALRRHFLAWERHGAAGGGRGDPVARAGVLSLETDEALRELSGGTGWDAVGPGAAFDYLRLLLARRGALDLDTAWRKEVLDPYLLAPGGHKARRERLLDKGGLLERFLVDRASGLWTWRDKLVANAEWDGIPFTLSREFLDFCNAVLRRNAEPLPETLVLPFRTASVNIVGNAAERPIETRFALGAGREEQGIVHRNYPVEGTFHWNGETPARASVAVTFPSLTATAAFTGEEETRLFVSMLAEGSCSLPPDVFGNEAAALRRLGVEAVVVQARLENAEALIRHLGGKAPEPPESIIPADGWIFSASRR